MSGPASYLPTISALGLTCSSFFVAGGLTLSYVAVPSLLLAAPQSSNAYTPSSQLARQWRKVYFLGRAGGASCALLGASAYAYVAYYLPSNLETQKYLHAAAAVLSLLVIPFTATVMGPTNSTLMGRAYEGDAMKDLSSADVTEVGMPSTVGVKGMRTEDLLKKWAVLNATRSCILLLGVGCVLYAIGQN